MKKLNTLNVLLAVTLLQISALSHAYFDFDEGNFVVPTETNLYQLYQEEVLNQGLSPSEVRKLNNQTLKALSETPAIQAPKSTLEERAKTSYITQREAQRVLNTINTHQVVGNYQSMRYDPEGGIGFCFGRALYVHLALIYSGLFKDNIKKAFVVGEMKTGDMKWGFHVTTIAKGPNNTWWTIDNFSGRVQSVDDWFNTIFRYSTDKKLRIYITEAGKFGASAPKYNPYALNDEFYNDYFSDLMRWFGQSDVREYYRNNRFALKREDRRALEAAPPPVNEGEDEVKEGEDEVQEETPSRRRGPFRRLFPRRR